jgi:hypothetical protein
MMEKLSGGDVEGGNKKIEKIIIQLLPLIIIIINIFNILSLLKLPYSYTTLKNNIQLCKNPLKLDDYIIELEKNASIDFENETLLRLLQTPLTLLD